MLGTPHRRLTIHPDLTFQNTRHSFLHRFPRPLPQTVFDERKLIFRRHFPKQLHHLHHGIVVKSDMCAVAFRFGKILRPPAILILRIETKLQPHVKSLMILLPAILSKFLCQNPHLRSRRPIVESRIVQTLFLPQLFSINLGLIIFILRPSS